MKVNSPVGEFPFRVKDVSLKDGRLNLEGSMGAWPARVLIDRSDVPSLLRLAPKVVLGFCRLLTINKRRDTKGAGEEGQGRA